MAIKYNCKCDKIKEEWIMSENFKVREYLDPKLNDFLKNEKFLRYFEFLASENTKYNLTRITEIDEVYYKHFYDSLYLSKVIDVEHKSILDVGSGAGFPSIPLKIIYPSLKPTIIDSLNKRIDFLKELVKRLELENVRFIHGRAEEQDKIKKYDIVTARAVARLNILAEISLPYVKIGGYFIAFKSMNYEEELKEAKAAITKLGGKVNDIISYPVSIDENHVLIIIEKIKATPDIYPRHFSKIKKSPL